MNLSKNCELIIPSPGEVDFHEVEETPLSPYSLLVRTHLSGIRHGEDLPIFEGKSQSSIVRYPWVPQGWGVGEVVKVGNRVMRFAEGDWIFGPMRHRRMQAVEEKRAYLLEWIKKEFSVFTDPGVAALQCVHEAQIRYGDVTVFFGMGTVGLMAVQFALLSGAQTVIAVDPLPSRLQVAQRLGAHRTVADEWSPEILSRVETAHPDGVDAVIELSGTDAALRRATQPIRPGGALVAGGSRYGIQSLRAVREHCDRSGIRFRLSAPREGTSREEAVVIKSLNEKKVIVWPIITDTIPFESASKAYQEIQSDPDHHIKVLLSYSSI